MALRHVVVSAALVVGTFAVTRAVYSQDGEKPAGGQPSEEEMMKMVMERAATTEEHTKLAEMVGTWDAEMVMTGMDGKEMKSPGTMWFESVLGGRVIASRFKGEMMGRPFEGLGLEGYDKEAKQNWSLWCDTMSLKPMRSTGARNADGHLAMTSESFDCGMGSPCTMHFTFKKTDADHMVMEVENRYADNRPVEKWSMRYTRRK